jgi:hypothetical protein
MGSKGHFNPGSFMIIFLREETLDYAENAVSLPATLSREILESPVT